jgi:hypothetical protein
MTGVPEGHPHFFQASLNVIRLYSGLFFPQIPHREVTSIISVGRAGSGGVAPLSGGLVFDLNLDSVKACNSELHSQREFCIFIAARDWFAEKQQEYQLPM